MKYTCPCCGYKTLENFPGSFEICKICFWEDDSVQLLNPWYRGGANKPFLVDCQKAFERISAKEERAKSFVRTPTIDDIRDPEWRPVNEHDIEGVRAPKDLSIEEWNKLETWYYWKRNTI